MAIYSIDNKRYKLEVDNIHEPRSAMLNMKLKDVVYHVNIKQEPFEYLDVKFVGNENAFLQSVSIAFLFLFVYF